MEAKDIPKNWPDHLNMAIKNLSDCILPALKYSPNELLLSLPINSQCMDNPEDIEPPTDTDIVVHLALAEQQLDRYSAIVDHTVKCKAKFNKTLLQHMPREVVFKVGDLV